MGNRWILLSAGLQLSYSSYTVQTTVFIAIVLRHLRPSTLLLLRLTFKTIVMIDTLYNYNRCLR